MTVTEDKYEETDQNLGTSGVLLAGVDLPVSDDTGSFPEWMSGGIVPSLVQGALTLGTPVTGVQSSASLTFQEGDCAISDATLIAYGISEDEPGIIEILGGSSGNQISDSVLYAGYSESQNTSGNWSSDVKLYGVNAFSGEVIINGNLLNLSNPTAGGAETRLEISLSSAVTVTGNLSNDSEIVISGTLNAENVESTGSITIAGGGLLSVSGEITGTGTITVESTGDGLAHKVIDYTGSGVRTLSDYESLIDGYDAAFYAVVDNDLYYNDSTTAYINSSYAGTSATGTLTADGHVNGINAFSSYADAVSADRLVQIGGAGTGFNAANGKSLTVQGGTGTTAGILLGGAKTDTDTRNWLELEGDIAMTIESGTFGSNVIGADLCNTGSLLRTGDVYMTISGGTFNKAIAGGLYYRTKDRGTIAQKSQNIACLAGNVNMVITGGVFNNRIYAGNYSTTDNDGAKTAINGNVNLTIRADQPITFNNHIIGGSRGEGWIYGDVTVTFSGDGDNLTFKKGVTVYGGSGSSYRLSVSRMAYPYVTGNFGMIFQDFQNDFDADIWMMDFIEFKGDTRMTFTVEDVKLTDISQWRLNWDGDENTWADLSCVENTFTGDTVSICLDQEGTGNDVLLKGTTGVFETLTAATVKFGTTAIAYNQTDGCWTDGVNTLKIESDGDMDYLKMTKLA